MITRQTIGGLVALLALLGARASAQAPVSTVEFFEKQVRPLLADQCLGCHGAAASASNGGLRMTSREDLLKGGARGPAIIIGHPEASLLVKAITYTEKGLAMPPRARLTDPQIAILTDWVRNGAFWPPKLGQRGSTTPVVAKVFDLQARRASHWAWKPVIRPSVPFVKDRTWPTSTIDSFILSRLEARGLKPAPPAERRTLIRRVTFDLTGLPPTPAEVEDFVMDRSPSAYAKVVDRLLASPHYGERWARHWLDLVRYAETDGHEWDLEKLGAYQYRDYVIRAFNADVSYKQFAQEQLAGDLLPSPRLNPQLKYNESVLGTGFFWLGAGTHSPVDLLDDQADHMDNEIDVLSKTFLGLGIGCARCHDHKFDAVSQKDYYSLFGILKSTRKQIAPVGAPTAPAVMAELRSVRNEINRILLASAREQVCANHAHESGWFKTLSQTATDNPADVAYPLYSLANCSNSEFDSRRKRVLDRIREQSTRSATESGSSMAIDWFGVTGTTTGAWTATGEAFTPSVSGSRLDVRITGDAKRHVQSAFWADVADSGVISDRLHGAVRSQNFTIQKQHIIYRVAGTGARVRLIVDGLQVIRDPLYGGLQFSPDSQKMVWYTQDVSMWVGHQAYIELQDVDPGFVALDRVGFTNGGPPSDAPSTAITNLLQDPAINTVQALQEGYVNVFARALAAGEGNGDADGKKIIAALLPILPVGTTYQTTLEQLSQRRDVLEKQITEPEPALAAIDGIGDNERIHMRGNYRNPGVLAPRHFLQACDGAADFASAKGSGRLALAQRLASDTDPLFARVMVNRIWQHNFAEGIVRTPDDFGVMGKIPTHPDLLDWLASEFERTGWSIKKMQRMIVMSSTYRMDSRSDTRSDATDPENLLLHRMPVQRLEAEAIRDAILAVSGRLDQKICGPPVMPHMNSFTVGRGAPPSGPLDGDGRRSIYISVRRGFPVPMLSAFDLPVPATTIGRRTVSSVPAQALTLLNDPFIVEQAGVWAKRILAEHDIPEQRIRNMYQAALGRQPDSVEFRAALAYVDSRQAGSNELKTWTDLCHVLFNVKEFIFIR